MGVCLTMMISIDIKKKRILMTSILILSRPSIFTNDSLFKSNTVNSIIHEIGWHRNYR